jgi:hypothetical protein
MIGMIEYDFGQKLRVDLYVLLTNYSVSYSFNFLVKFRFEISNGSIYIVEF